ncbi:MAG: RdgB/HAM1 family non-canonical purine NTP pyrophosphatase [Bacteroidales bacterium]|jgi:XTP/dITP diphosphohydrolase|nr:RdgB/HAM1 family non-canonical purine NTP pyrophosphatase [Bacteroidales bacterium]
MTQSFIFATANPHKLEEVKAMLPAHIRLRSLSDIGFSGDIPETEPTLEGNALQKARYIFDRFGKPCFSDDTGLEVEALNGAPGVYSARYAGATGSQEEKAQANMSKLLAELSGIGNRKARFRTVIAYMDASGNAHLFEGTVNGAISEEPCGTTGFGYDPLFVPEGYDLCFAQMPLDEKNRISHRARAFGKFADQLRMENEKHC